MGKSKRALKGGEGSSAAASAPGEHQQAPAVLELKLDGKTPEPVEVGPDGGFQTPCSITGLGAGLSGGMLGYAFGFGECGGGEDLGRDSGRAQVQGRRHDQRLCPPRPIRPPLRRRLLVQEPAQRPAEGLPGGGLGLGAGGAGGVGALASAAGCSSWEERGRARRGSACRMSHPVNKQSTGRLRPRLFACPQTFAIMGGLYAAVTCFAKRLRQKEDGACWPHAAPPRRTRCPPLPIHCYSRPAAAGGPPHRLPSLLLRLQVGTRRRRAAPRGSRWAGRVSRRFIVSWQCHALHRHLCPLALRSRRAVVEGSCCMHSPQLSLASFAHLPARPPARSPAGGPASALQSCALFGGFSYFIEQMGGGAAQAAAVGSPASCSSSGQSEAGTLGGGGSVAPAAGAPGVREPPSPGLWLAGSSSSSSDGPQQPGQWLEAAWRQLIGQQAGQQAARGRQALLSLAVPVMSALSPCSQLAGGGCKVVRRRGR